MVMPIPASIACTTTGAIASAARAIRLSPNTICRIPAPTVIRQVTFHPNLPISSATTTVRPAAGPLTCSGEPPTAPATTPPTIAAIRPAMIGAPEAIAIPNDRGSATRNTTSDAGTSYLISCSRYRLLPPPGGDESPTTLSSADDCACTTDCVDIDLLAGPRIRLLGNMFEANRRSVSPIDCDHGSRDSLPFP